MLSAMFVSAAVVAADVRTSLRPMFEQHCFGCHDHAAKEGGLDLTALSWQPEDETNQIRWIKLYDKVRLGEMPPKEESQPSPKMRSDFLENLRTALYNHSADRQAIEGRTALRRLNRTEYENTLHELFGVDTPLRELLPEDALVNGFDTVGSALELSAVHLEMYLDAAERALKEAIVSGPKPTMIRETHNHQATADFYKHFYTEFGITSDGRLGIRLSKQIPIGEIVSWKGAPQTGRYRIRIRAQAFMDKDSRAATAQDKKLPPRSVIMTVGLKRGRADVLEHLAFLEIPHEQVHEVELTARISAGKSLYIAPHRIVPEQSDEPPMPTGAAIALESVVIEGPIFEAWPPRGHKLIFGDLPLVTEEKGKPSTAIRGSLQVFSENPEVDAKRLIQNFLPKLFRRPVSETEASEFVGLAIDQMKQGRPFDDAILAAVKMALSSPQFLFLQEKPGPLDDYAIASRLSYFFWSGPPDDELLTLASEGRLRDSATLHTQTERLLQSPRASAFTKNFLANWLNLRDIDFTQPDTKLYPEFEAYLQSSMLRETYAFFDELLRHDLSARNVIDSEFAMLNERLAEHYGVSSVKGDNIRRVTLPSDAHRGGFMTQGAILKVSANGTTTSPVVRGAYVLSRLLGTPPDPPPPNVPSIEPDIRGATTIREQLERHRNEAQCASCHSRLDPPGFALESFDVTGRRRTAYRVIPGSSQEKVVKRPGSDVRYYTHGSNVNAAYQLADGRAFTDIDEFQQLLLNDEDQIARCFLEKLITHATGAPPQFADQQIIEAILQRTHQQGHGLRTLVHEVVQSSLFLSK
jgi:hypothetical protein